jgi:AbrB family looped-hinge helix DNA binding protein
MVRNMGLSKVTRNYQITLPKDVREIEGIKIGDRLMITVKDEGIVMKKIKGKILDRCFGAWKSAGSGVSYARKIRDESEKREKELGL